MVRCAEYEDPHELTLYKNPELNTIYWPKLCLDMTPTVDMLDHDGDGVNSPAGLRTPLNDDNIYAFEQLKAKRQFEEFTWTHPEAFEDETPRDEDEAVTGTEGDGEPLTWSISEYTEQLHEVAGKMPARTSADYASEPGESIDAAASTGEEPSAKSEEPEPVSSPISAHRQLPEESVCSPSLTAPPSPIVTPPEQENQVNPLSPIAPLSPATGPTSPPKAIQVPSPRNKRDLALPTGLPSTGLSSSDVVSIPSPDPHSPTRLIRRHTAAQPSIDSNANSRLSVDLHGTISRLGEDDWDWEQLDLSAAGGCIPSVSNAAPSAFFTRRFGQVLGRGRRPSTLVTSGLRRQVKTSDSSRELSSPTKQRQLFTVKSIENTKNFVKKAFPKRLKRDSKTGGEKGRVPSTATSTGARSPSPTATPPRPGMNPRSVTTESVSAPNTATVSSSWFSTRKLRPGSRAKKTSNAYSSSSSDSGTNLAVSTGQLTLGPGGVPRVELTHTPPVVWELDRDEKLKGVRPLSRGGDDGVAPLPADLKDMERSRST